jgi:carbonic anhydrase
MGEIMSRIIGGILADLKKAEIINNYHSKHRWIPMGLYRELKSRVHCDYCHKRFSGQIPEVHHKIPVEHGGSNTDINNLMAVHHHCHQKLDYALGVGAQFYSEKIVNKRFGGIVMELNKIETTLEELRATIDPMKDNLDKRQKGQVECIQTHINGINNAIKKLRKLMETK